jgi:putative transposase
MRTFQSTLTRAAVQDYCQQLLHRQLRLPDHGPRVTASRLYAVLLYVAATASTIAQACRALLRAPSDQSVYDALEATLPQRAELQRRLNRALAATLPKAVRRGRRRYPVAIDLTLLPYYGRPDANDDQVYKGPEKASTHHHYAYATAYLVRKGRRFTLALRSVRHDDPWDDIVRSLLRQVKKVLPGFRLVLVDRGFWSVAVIRYLQRARYPFILPVIGRGRKASHPRGPSGTQAFFAWRHSGWSRYTLSNRNDTARAQLDIAVKVRRRRPTRPGRKRPPPRVLVYGCWGVRGRDPGWVDQAYQARRVDWVKQTYRGRFGIETSYRQMNQGRGWTTSRRPVRRLLLVGLALLLRNVWALLHLVVLAERRRGGRRLQPELLTLAALLAWVADALKERLGARDRVETQHPFTL